ncbi:MAG: hypothetical protein K2W94_03510 [Alphaproteobacteria bacterium]|nr:hypothetical protein [Alphaproteobacteria bacterium]
MIYYVIFFVLSLGWSQANSAESFKTPRKLEPLKEIPSFKSLIIENDKLPSSEKPAKQLEPLEKVPSFKSLKIADTPAHRKPAPLDPLPAKAEPVTKSLDGFESVSSGESFISVDSFPSVTESMTTDGRSTSSPIKETHKMSHEALDEGLMPAEFHLTERVQKLMSDGEFTSEAVLEMLRPRPEAPEAFAISTRFYNPDGSPILGAIRVIEGNSETKGSFTDSLFLVQINTNFLQEKEEDASSKEIKMSRVGLLRDLKKIDWQTKIVIKVLKSEGMSRKIGIHKVSFESVAKDQIKNLEKIKTSRLSNINYFKNPNLPRMTFDEASYYYVDNTGTKRYFSILHSARGMPFSEIWKNYEDKNITVDQLQESAYAIGRALGAFHTYTKAPENIHSSDDFRSYKPIAHGDFYWQNVFYDFKTQRVYFIDNESMAKSFEAPPSVETDFLRFYAHQLFGSYPDRKKCNINRCAQEDVKIVYRAFFKGYIHAYPTAVQPMLTDYIKKVVHDYNESVKGIVMPREVSSVSLKDTGEPQLIEGARRLQLLFDEIFA